MECTLLILQNSDFPTFIQNKVLARATDAKLGANGVVFQPGFDGTTPAPPNPENSIIYFYIFPIYFLYIIYGNSRSTTYGGCYVILRDFMKNKKNS